MPNQGLDTEVLTLANTYELYPVDPQHRFAMSSHFQNCHSEVDYGANLTGSAPPTMVQDADQPQGIDQPTS